MKLNVWLGCGLQGWSMHHVPFMGRAFWTQMCLKLAQRLLGWEVRSSKMCSQPAGQGRLAFTSPQEGIGRKCSSSHYQWLWWAGKKKKEASSVVIWGAEGFHFIGIPWCCSGFSLHGLWSRSTENISLKPLRQKENKIKGNQEKPPHSL